MTCDTGYVEGRESKRRVLDIEMDLQMRRERKKRYDLEGSFLVGSFLQ